MKQNEIMNFDIYKFMGNSWKYIFNSIITILSLIINENQYYKSLIILISLEILI